MKVLTTNKYLMWLILSFLLISSFFLGMFLFASSLEVTIIIFVVLIISFCIQVLLILNFVSRIENRLKIGMLTTHSLNLLFAIVIGFSISVMESDFKYNFGIVMIPLLLIFSLVITDKYHSNIKDLNHVQEENPKEKSTRPVIEFEEKKYIFSLNSLIILGVGTPLLALVTYSFFDIEAQFWLHEVVVKQTIYFLNLFFDMNVSTSYIPSGKYHWSFKFDQGNINGDPLGSIFFETFCTGIQAIAVFIGIIICTPHSKDKRTNKDIIWRKAKALIVSSVIFYVVNVIRMLIQIELYYLGYPWDSIHVSISAASSFIAAIIIILLHKWIPEFIISIIYMGTLISRKVKNVRKPKEE